MRIDAYNQIAQIYSTSKPAATSAKKTTMGRDEVQISSKGRDIQVAKQAVKNASDIREDKVADMKAKLAAGTYDVTAEDFAAKLLEKLNSF